MELKSICFWGFGCTFKEHIFSTTKNLTNVRLYDFTTNIELTTNLNMYKDLTHFKKEVNQWIIES